MTNTDKPAEPDEIGPAPEPVDAAGTEDAASDEAPGIEAIKVDEAELLAEIERLRDENEKLVAARTSDSHIGRRVATVVLIVLGAILFGLGGQCCLAEPHRHERGSLGALR